MTKLTTNMTISEAIITISQKNIGAMQVLMASLKRGKEIIKPSKYQELDLFLAFDALEIYGPRIWQLFTNVCGQSYITMHLLCLSAQRDEQFKQMVNKWIDQNYRITARDFDKVVNG